MHINTFFTPIFSLGTHILFDTGTLSYFHTFSQHILSETFRLSDTYTTYYDIHSDTVTTRATMPLHCVQNCPKDFETSRKASLTHHQAQCPAYLAKKTAAEHLRVTRSKDRKLQIAARQKFKSIVWLLVHISVLAVDLTFSSLTFQVVWAQHLFNPK